MLPLEFWARKKKGIKMAGVKTANRKWKQKNKDKVKTASRKYKNKVNLSYKQLTIDFFLGRWDKLF